MRRLSFAASLIFLAAWLIAPAQAAIPTSERQVLLNLYSSAGGSSWTQSYGWVSSTGSGNGAAGTECGSSSTHTQPWYGVTCDVAGTHVIGIYLVQNGLAGTLPALAGLSQLQSFNVGGNNFCGSAGESGCSLGGAIPDLSALTQLQSFSIDGDGFSGVIPALTALTNLQGIDLANNNLSGPIPSLDGLGGLLGFNVAGNRLSGSIPSLNSLTHLQVFDVDNNSLNGTIPSLSSLGNLQTFYAFSNQLNGAIPGLTGLTGLQFLNVNDNQLSGTIPSLSGLVSLQNFSVDGNQLTGSIPDLSGLGALNVLDVGKNQLSGLVPAAPSPNNLAIGQSVLCTNAFTASVDTQWDTATGTTPWYTACGLSLASGSGVNLDQFGISGSWYNPAMSGQGFLLGTYPDSIAAGQGQIFLAWYTYKPSGATPAGQNWYLIQGTMNNTSASTTMSISAPDYDISGANFNAPPIVGQRIVGSATLNLSDCTHASLIYQFTAAGSGSLPTDPAAGLSGTIPLTRLSANTTCSATGDNGTAASDFLLSGAWYDPATSGQGMIFDINPSQSLFSAGWYTFSAAGPVWYTLQTGSFVAGSKTAQAVIATASGGLFDDPATATTSTVGGATITFQSCTAATVAYNFTSGINQGLTGTINLQRLGPTPAGCSL